jgi:nucleoside-diphosphate-sugar epimerase
LLNFGILKDYLNDVDYIIHIAGVTKAKGTKQLLRAASESCRIKKFCHISSLTAVGPSPDGNPLTETAECHPITTYGKSKLEAENICKEFINKLPIVIIRPPAVFGPRDTDIFEMFRWINRGFKPIMGSRHKSLSLAYAPDLAEGIVQATISEKTTGEIYNISDPGIFLFTSLMDSIASIAAKRTVNVHFPKSFLLSMAFVSQTFSLLSKKPAVFNIEKAKDLLQEHWVCSPDKILKHIGFRTSTPIDKALLYTFKWYKENGWT